MGRQMETIIKRQQEYERMKHMPLSVILNKRKGIEIEDDFLADRVIPEIRKAYDKKRTENNVKKCVFVLAIVCASLFLLMMFVLFVCVTVNWRGDMSAEDAALQEAYEASPIRQAERAIESGDYGEAEKMLAETLEENPDSIFLYITYANLYLAEGRNDDAVEMLADTIYNRFHVQNVFTPENQLYTKLREIPERSLRTSQEIYRSCLDDCDAYIGKYEKMNSLIEQESYYSALLSCDELKSEGAYDSYLIEPYYQCYCGLKAYDECAEYLIGLYGKQQGGTDFRYPSDGEIRLFLEKIKAMVSSEMAKRIGELEL